MKSETYFIGGVILFGVVAIVYLLNQKKNQATPGVNGLGGAAGNALGTTAGQTVFGALNGFGASIGQGLSDVYGEDFDPAGVELVNGPGSAQYDAAQEYAANGYQ